MRRTNKDRSEATQRALLSAARELFADKGFAETSTPQIVARAEVTRGALYHHFTEKADVLRAVIEAEAAAVADTITAATQDQKDPHLALVQGSEAYFEAMAVPGRARLLLLEAPAVLGTMEVADIDKNTGSQTLVEWLQLAAESGKLAGVPLEPLAEILGAAFDRAALAIANGEPAEPYRKAARSLLECLLR